MLLVVLGLVVIGLALAACSGDDDGAALPTTSPAAPASSVAPGSVTSSPVSITGRPESLTRPDVLFSAQSPFNRPIPDDPELAPDSGAMVEGIIDQVRQQGIVLAVRESAIAVYEVDASTPRHDVPLSIDWGSASVFGGVPIPSYARADSNNDHEIALFDRTSGCEWDFWQFRPVGDSWVASWGNSTRLDGGGIYEQGGGARAGGSALLAGLVWPEELAAGQIDHALVFSYGLTRADGPVAPAVGSDGWSSSPQAIPEGALVQLDPEFDVDSLQYEFERTIARAMQVYGMYLMDSTSVGIGLYAVNPVSFEDEPYEALIPSEAWEEGLWAVLDIPPERFRVLAYGPQDPDPPTDPVAAEGCGELRGGWRSGVWGSAVSDGTLYVAAGDRGLEIVDVSDPTHPVRLGGYDAYGNDLEPVVSVAVRGDIAYLGTDGAGIQALDVSDPADPRPLGQYGADEEYLISSLSLDGDTLYAVGDVFLHVLDVGGRGLEPMALVEDEDVIATARDVSVADGRAYIADQWFELVIMDVTDPARPAPVGEFMAEAQGLTQTYGSGVVVPVAGLAYYTDEDLGFGVLDVSDAGTPELVGSVDLEDFAFGVDVAGTTAYVANGAGGLQILDVSDPSDPGRVAEVSIDGYAVDVTVAGGIAYVAARDGGVALVDVTSSASPVLVGTYRP